MEFEIESHRWGESLLGEPGIKEEWEEVTTAIESISDKNIMETHAARYQESNKSISKAINYLLMDRLVAFGWAAEPAIFNHEGYHDKRFRLDFAKEKFSIEVAFNHGEAIAWNLLKPVLASELNHVEKEISTDLGIVIMATQEMKKAGGFDSAVGTYEKARRYLHPLQNQLSCPIILIGLKAPRTFKVKHVGKPKRAEFVLNPRG